MDTTPPPNDSDTIASNECGRGIATPYRPAMNDRYLTFILAVIGAFAGALGLLIGVVGLATSGAMIPAAAFAGYLAGALTASLTAIWVANRLRPPP
jgi:hypothetical protein